MFIAASFVVGGLGVTYSAYKNSDSFMLHPKAYWFVRLFGRNTMRVVYGLMGIGSTVFGVCLLNALMRGGH